MLYSKHYMSLIHDLHVQYGSAKSKPVLRLCSLLHGHTIASLEEEGFDISPAYLFFFSPEILGDMNIQICATSMFTQITCA